MLRCRLIRNPISIRLGESEVKEDIYDNGLVDTETLIQNKQKQAF